MKKLSVIHLPTTVGGNPQGLSRAERQLGLNSISIAFLQNYFLFPADRILFKHNFFLNEIKRWKFIYLELVKYDIVHYNFGSLASPHIIDHTTGGSKSILKKIYNKAYASLLEGVDLKILKNRKKVIAVTYQGDDARQGNYCRINYPIHFVHHVGSKYYSDFSDKLKKRRIQLFDVYADLIYSVNPDLLNVLPKRSRFIPYASVDPDDWQPLYVDQEPECPHLVHAPSNRLIKGTPYIDMAVKRLQNEGVCFRYTQIEGMSNVEARKIYETADLLVDQLLAGWYGALAVELMALGKPVICYIREEDLHYIPDKMKENIPIINANPETIYSVLKQWLTSRKKELRNKGIISRKYVEEWHDPLKIASIIKTDYEEVLYANRSNG